MSLLAVYNTCGLSAKNNTEYYIQAINGLLNQDCQGLHVIMSDCCSPEKLREKIRTVFTNRISYNFIDTCLPVSVTFNDSVRNASIHFGNFDKYLYVDSGINVTDSGAITQMVKLMDDNPEYGMIATQVDKDHGYLVWNITLNSDGSPTIIPVGKTVNLHCQLFSSKYWLAYGKLLPDIFAADTMESVFTFMLAAIGQKLVVHPTVKMHHEWGLDGPSIGFGRGRKLFRSPKNHDTLCREGRPLGFGYEECERVCLHDHNLYNEQGFPHHPEPLYNFILNNLFLSPDFFNYKTEIKRKFIP